MARGRQYQARVDVIAPPLTGATGFFNLGWLQEWRPPDRPVTTRARPLAEHPAYFGAAVQPFIAPRYGWFQPLGEPDRPITTRARPLAEHPAHVLTLVEPFVAPSIGWLRPLDEPNRTRKPVPENPEPVLGQPQVFVVPSIGWLPALSEPDRPITTRARPLVEHPAHVLAFVEPFVAPNYGWYRPLDEPNRARKPIPEFPQPVPFFFIPAGATGFFNLGWLQALAEPDSRITVRARPLAEHPAYAGAFVEPFVAPSIGWLRPLDEPNRPRKPIPEFPQPVPFFFIPPGGATGFFDLGWLQALSEPNVPRRQLPEFPQPLLALVPRPYTTPSVGWLRPLDEPNRPRRAPPELTLPILVPQAPPAFVSFAWFSALSEPLARRRLYVDVDGNVFFAPSTSAAWMGLIDQPIARRQLIIGPDANVFFTPVPPLGWLGAPDQPLPRRALILGPDGNPVFVPSVQPSLGWLRQLDQPITPVKRFWVDIDRNVFFIPPGGATGFFNLGWLRPFSEPNVPRRPLPEFPAAFLGYTPQRYAPFGATLLAPALIRALVAEIRARDVAASPERVRTATLVPNWPMSQAQDLVPPIDADGEEETIGFDFGPAINPLYPKVDSGVRLVTNPAPSITCQTSAVSAVQDPNAPNLILSAPSLVASKRTGAPSAQWNILFGNTLAGVTYMLRCLALTTDGQQLSIWVRLPAVGPS